MTATSETPATPLTAFSTWAWHDAQVMPPTSNFSCAMVSSLPECRTALAARHPVSCHRVVYPLPPGVGTLISWLLFVTVRPRLGIVPCGRIAPPRRGAVSLRTRLDAPKRGLCTIRMVDVTSKASACRTREDSSSPPQAIYLVYFGDMLDGERPLDRTPLMQDRRGRANVGIRGVERRLHSRGSPESYKARLSRQPCTLPHRLR